MGIPCLLFAERGGQSDGVINRDPIGLKIPKMGVITTKHSYHAQVWEYPPRVFAPEIDHKSVTCALTYEMFPFKHMCAPSILITTRSNSYA